jgi:hypothetical protein
VPLLAPAVLVGELAFNLAQLVAQRLLLGGVVLSVVCFAESL